MKRKNVRIAVLAAAVGGVGMMFGATNVVSASILTGPNPYGNGAVDTIYSDNFTAPATNVNSAGADPNSIVGNPVAGGDGGSGGTPGAAYIGIAQPAATGATDAVWNYSGSTSATITSPTTPTTEDANTIANLTLPLVPIVGDVYDFEATITAPAAAGGHGLEMAFLFNNGNGRNTAVQAISNNDPIGLILDRDAAGSTSSIEYFEIFESTGTGSDNSFSPTASALTGGTPGTTVTVDEIYTPTSATAGTESVYLNGILATSTPFSLSGLTGGISDIQFGDNRDGSGNVTNFSLTASPVPEPASTGVLLVGAALAMKRRRRSSKE